MFSVIKRFLARPWW